jgi:hypothetical protein
MLKLRYNEIKVKFKKIKLKFAALNQQFKSLKRHTIRAFINTSEKAFSNWGICFINKRIRKFKLDA